MNYKEFKAMEEFSYRFYDTIDFKQFIPDLGKEGMNEDLDDIIVGIEDYYFWNSSLLPKELEGDFFNYVGDEEFAEYLKKRYNLGIETQIIEKHYLFTPNKSTRE